MRQATQSMLQRWGIGLLVLFLSACLFHQGIENEKYFEDEGAYLAGSYYYRLVKEGRLDDVDWFYLGSYDHLQVGRWMIGAALDARGLRLSDSTRELEAWYGADGIRQTEIDPSEVGRLFAARMVMMFGGAIGCWAIFIIGKQMVGPITGLVAALLLGGSPLYLIHARRAMPDDWVIAFGLIGLTCVFFVAKRLPLRRGYWFHLTRTLPGIGVAGIAFGLSAATKLSGISILIAVLVNAGLLLALSAPWRVAGPTHTVMKRWGIVILGACVVAAGTFVAAHPFFYARPKLPPINPDQPTLVVDGQARNAKWIDDYVRPLADAGIGERLRYLVQYRQSVLDDPKIQERFPKDKLPTTASRIAAMLHDGWGKHVYAANLGLTSSFSSFLVGTLVLSGLIWCGNEGTRLWKMGMLPIPWMLIIWFAVEGAILTRELSLNWDRYYMGWITITALLSAVGIGGPISSMGRRLVLLPPMPPEERPSSPTTTTRTAGLKSPPDHP
jgi:hypothetical protein